MSQVQKQTQISETEWAAQEFRNKPIWSINLRQKRQEHTTEKGSLVSQWIYGPGAQ